MKGKIKRMEETSLRLANDQNLFSRLTISVAKLFTPTRVGINGMLISIRRNNVLKAFEEYQKIKLEEDDSKKNEEIVKKYDKAYSLYLEAIDKHIMDSIYKKVKHSTASDFEKNSLANYYTIIKLKENEFLEYKYIKQQYLLRLDYETIIELGKVKLEDKYVPFYTEKMDSLYKGVLKHYSIKLSDNITMQNKEIIYQKIFTALEEYISEILPLKMASDDTGLYEEIVGEYNEFDAFSVGKLDENDGIEKKMLLLSLSRKLFTHSLPLVVAEQCYIQLIKEVRNYIVKARTEQKKEKNFKLLIKLIEDYNVKLLSTKVYWDKPEKREFYKNFWADYQEIENGSMSRKEYERQKQILFVKSDLKEVYVNPEKYQEIIKFYKSKLRELGAMKSMKLGKLKKKKYTGEKVLCQMEKMLEYQA